MLTNKAPGRTAGVALHVHVLLWVHMNKTVQNKAALGFAEAAALIRVSCSTEGALHSAALLRAEYTTMQPSMGSEVVAAGGRGVREATALLRPPPRSAICSVSSAPLHQGR